MSRSKGRRKPCDVPQARLRLVDARQFLAATELLDAPDVVGERSTARLSQATKAATPPEPTLPVACSGPSSCSVRLRVASKRDCPAAH